MALKENWQAIGLALLYITIIASLSCLPSWKYLLFPELAALSYEVLLHPRGPWASQPWQLVFTLTATALLGVILTQNIDYDVISVLLVVVLSAIIICCLRSAITPAFSAGLMPLVLGIHSWFYPMGIFLALCLLVLFLKAYLHLPLPPHKPEGIEKKTDNQSGNVWWPLLWLGFITAMVIAAQGTGLRFVLFPPLTVISYQAFCDPRQCIFAKRPWLLIGSCGLTATAGVLAAQMLPSLI